MKKRGPKSIVLNRRSQPGKAPRCPMCDMAIDTVRRRKIVDERAAALKAQFDSAVEEARSGKKGWKQKQAGGLIIPSSVKEKP